MKSFKQLQNDILYHHYYKKGYLISYLS